MLGVSVAQLRALIKTHILKKEDMTHDTLATLRPSDLLILRILKGNC